MESTDAFLRWRNDVVASENNHERERPDVFDLQPESLCTASHVRDALFGTGHAVYRASILSAIETAQHEVILVTCFWARSPTLDALNGALRRLSVKGTASGTRVRVRICFSSSSLFQKLFHTRSLHGQTYSPCQWTKQLGLPPLEELSGLDLEVKSIFLLPLSVMHPKFVIIDQKSVLLPSCNVSWETWYEGCLRLKGPIVQLFALFWQTFWARMSTDSASSQATGPVVPSLGAASDKTSVMDTLSDWDSDVQTIFLPSAHHQNPNFALPWQSCRTPPLTPRNTFILSLFSEAKLKIIIRTPNLTSPPVLTALLAALRRGIDVTIITNDGLMILEQLCTAGTTTSHCLKMLVKRYKRIVREYASEAANTLESGSRHLPGDLQIHIYRAPPGSGEIDADLPMQSHVKLTIVDDQWIIMGSGNMDRASWYTSQELDVAFYSQSLAVELHKKASHMETGIRRFYDSRAGT